MIRGLWRYASVSVAGTSHAKTGTPCQDASACHIMQTVNGSNVLIAIASDGAGSAKCADEGSMLACSLMIDEMKAFFECGNYTSDISRDFIEAWLVRFQREVSLRTEDRGLAAREFACTLLTAIVDEDCSVFFQIGDGAIVISDQEDPDEYVWVFLATKGGV